jgi:hypothetical protein
MRCPQPVASHKSAAHATESGPVALPREDRSAAVDSDYARDGMACRIADRNPAPAPPAAPFEPDRISRLQRFPQPLLRHRVPTSSVPSDMERSARRVEQEPSELAGAALNYTASLPELSAAATSKPSPSPALPTHPANRVGKKQFEVQKIFGRLGISCRERFLSSRELEVNEMQKNIPDPAAYTPEQIADCRAMTHRIHLNHAPRCVTCISEHTPVNAMATRMACSPLARWVIYPIRPRAP